MIGVAVFGVLTFTITTAVTMTFAPDPKKATVFTVTLPSGKTGKFSELDREHAAVTHALFFDASNQSSLVNLAYRSQKQNLFGQALRIGSWMFGQGNQSAEAKKDKKNDDVLQIMLVNAVARDRGIEVATSEVAEWLSNAFSSTEEYSALVGYLRMNYPQFESVLREALLYKRAQDLMLAQTPLPSGDDLLKDWSQANERFVFEVATFSAEDRKKTMKPEDVTNEALKKWFDAKKDLERSKYQEPEKMAIEGIAVTNAAMTAGKWNEAFAALEKGVVLQDTDAQTYYSMARQDRFKKEAAASKPAPPESGPASQPESSPASKPIVEYVTFEEAKDNATKEARIARALEKIKTEAMEAMNKPGFDLKAIAEKYGLLYFNTGEPKTLGDLRKDAVHGCLGWIMGVSDAKEGDFLASYQPAPGAIQISRLTKKTPSRVPDVADIRDKILSDYLDEKAAEKARDDATAFRDAVVDANIAEGENRFQKVAKEKGVELKTLAPIARTTPVYENPDFNFMDIGKDVSQYLMSLNQGGVRLPDPFALKKDGISTPLANNEAKTTYVVHVLDRIVPTIADLSVAEYPKYKERSLLRLRQKKCLDMTNSEALSKVLQLKRRGDTGFAQ
jgi:hypothetical protein